MKTLTEQEHITNTITAVLFEHKATGRRAIRVLLEQEDLPTVYIAAADRRPGGGSSETDRIFISLIVENDTTRKDVQHVFHYFGGDLGKMVGYIRHTLWEYMKQTMRHGPDAATTRWRRGKGTP